MNSQPTIAHPADDSLEQGIALVLRAEESGNWKAVADWMAVHADHAASLGRFLSGQRDIAETLTPSSSVLGPGFVVGGYELREKIGQGGMGIVFRAHDPVLNRDVAVKLVRPAEGFGMDRLARFRFEAKTVANLDHPNVVRVFASGEVDGMPYLVMPLMEGGSLADKLTVGGVFAPRAAAELIRDIACGVHHSHQEGLIHRDLKPGNILLDSDARPHVADFGLARSLEASTTVSGGIAGTPAYMAPEQARGDKRLTVALDIHALGAILFQLLTGRTPFGADDILLTLKRLQDEPAPALRSFRKDAPADLEAICGKCMEKEPADRYPSAQALADDLTRFLNGEPLAGQQRRGIFTSVRRAVDHRRDTREMSSWATPFWGAASSLLALVVLQLAILLDAPRWVPDAALVYYLVAWFGIVWYFLLVRRHEMNPVETGSLATQFGMITAASLVTLQHWLDCTDIESVFPSLAAVVGLGVYVHGAMYWGRLYLAGLGIMSMAAIMPLIPMRFWPGLYGLVVSAFQVWVGFHLMAIHRQAQKNA
ncbi:MAG: serine/threonine-protein kinase [Gemmataceae bacterium]